MNSQVNRYRQFLDTFSASLPVIILALIILSLPLSAAEILGLTEGETISWILVLYAVSSLLTIPLTLIYKQPLLLTGNLFVIIFIVSLGSDLSYPELTGASMLAGVGVLTISLLGLNRRLSRWLPAPIVLGLLLGAIMPFLTEMFEALGQSPIIVGTTLISYIVGRTLLKERLPAILPALILGLVATALTGQFNPGPEQLEFILPAITLPRFSIRSILTAGPVMIVLITLQSNLPSIVFLKSQGFEVRDRAIGVTSGIGTMLGSLLGPNGISLSLPATSLLAGEQAGPKSKRHRAVYLTAGIALLIGLLAGFAAEIPAIIPRPLLLALAGLAIFNIFVGSLDDINKSPLTYGPMFAFAASLSDVSLLGFGSFFWGLILGTGVSWLWERDGLEQIWADESL